MIAILLATSYKKKRTEAVEMRGYRESIVKPGGVGGKDAKERLTEWGDGEGFVKTRRKAGVVERSKEVSFHLSRQGCRGDREQSGRGVKDPPWYGKSVARGGSWVTAEREKAKKSKRRQGAFTRSAVKDVCGIRQGPGAGDRVKQKR